ncbi:unnamed protein product, partial [Closterium sp. NIES-54]
VLRYLCSTSGLGLVLGGRSPVVLTGHADASWVDDLAMQRSSQGYTFSLGSGSVSWRSTRSSSVLSSSCEAEIYAGAMAAQELRWLTYLLTDLGEPPCSPPFLYVDNKAMLALCREHSLEHRTKHIALRYFLARELQQRGQLRLAYVASEANTADIFTKALQPCDHQRFCTMLVEDLVTHLRTSDARYRAALPAEFLDRNPPPMYITLYFIVTRLPDSLRAVRDHFLALDPTYLIVDLLEKHLLTSETSVVAIGAARGTPRTPLFEGVPPPPLPLPTLLLLLLTSLVLRMSGLLLLLVGSAAAARARVAGVVAVAAGVVVVEAVEAVELAEVVARVGASVAAVVAAVGVAVVAAVGVVAEAVVAVGVELFRWEVLAVARGRSSSVEARPLCPSSFTCTKIHSQHHCFSRLDDASHAEFGDKAECPRWSELLRSGVDIFPLDYDAILAAMYALYVSVEGH